MERENEAKWSLGGFVSGAIVGAKVGSGFGIAAGPIGAFYFCLAV